MQKIKTAIEVNRNFAKKKVIPLCRKKKAIIGLPSVAICAFTSIRVK